MAKSIRKMFALMVSLVMIVSVCGCGKSDKEETKRKKRATKTSIEEITKDDVIDALDDTDPYDYTDTYSDTDFYTDDVVDTEPDTKGNDGERVEITFGTFEGEPIEWLVLDDYNGMKLMLSKYVLCERELDDGEDGCSWKRSDLRSWMNGEFFAESFSDEEKSKIEYITLNCFNDGTPDSGLAYTSNDHVFLMAAGNFDETPLSPEEMLGVRSSGGPSESWWLLSTIDNEVFYVDESGNICRSTDISCTEKLGVRPLILTRDLIAGPIEAGTGSFSDSDCGRVLDLMYNVTGQSYETAVKMVEEYFGTTLVNSFTMEETIRGEAPTDCHVYCTQIENGTAKFNEESFACNQGDGRVCRFTLNKSNSEYLESAYDPSEISVEETEAFFYDLCAELDSACGTPTISRSNRDATEVTVCYNFGPDCEIYAEFKNLDNGYSGVEIWFSNNAVKE
ncbi:MAG: hypothetical protein J5653_05235 [Clostridiales bacterium]|nr:hypothetical protein [Clostridiales bacterium]